MLYKEWHIWNFLLTCTSWQIDFRSFAGCLTWQTQYKYRYYLCELWKVIWYDTAKSVSKYYFSVWLWLKAGRISNDLKLRSNICEKFQNDWHSVQINVWKIIILILEFSSDAKLFWKLIFIFMEENIVLKLHCALPWRRKLLKCFQRTERGDSFLILLDFWKKGSVAQNVDTFVFRQEKPFFIYFLANKRRPHFCLKTQHKILLAFELLYHKKLRRSNRTKRRTDLTLLSL